MVTVCFFCEETKNAAVGIMFLQFGFFSRGELAFTGKREDALTVFVVRFIVGRLVADVNTRAIASELVAGGSSGFDGGWSGCFLFVDVVSGSKEKISGVREIFPFGWNDLFYQSFLTEVREGIFRESFDIITTDVGGVDNEGAVYSGFEFSDESAKARRERFKGLGGVVAFHICELLIICLRRTFKEG